MESPDVVIPVMKYCHIRYTPPNEGGISNMHEFKYPCLAYWEDKSKNGEKAKLHYHIATANMDCSNLRKYCRDFFNIPKGKRGEGNKYISVTKDFVDLSYVVKYGNQVRADLPDIDLEFLERESKKYLVQEKPVTVPPSNSVQCDKEKKPAEFDMLLSKWILLKRDDYNMFDIKKWICSVYLQKNKPIPRAGDLYRYSYSIYAISKEKTSEEDFDYLSRHAEFYGIKNIV